MPVYVEVDPHWGAVSGAVLAAPSYVSADLTNDLSVANTTQTFVVFNRENVDLLDEYDPTTGVFKAARDGIYSVTASVRWKNVNIGKSYFAYLVSTTETYYFLHNASGSTSDFTVPIAANVYLEAGQGLRIRVYQGSGETEVVGGSSSTVTFLRIARIAAL
jgi:hypothetical protein